MKNQACTIITEDAYLILQEEGVLTCNSRLIDTDFKESYDWMVKQMKERIGNPPENVEYPLWCWITEPDDLDYFGDVDKTNWLVKFNYDPKDMLISNYNDWHSVLNNWYLSLTEEEDSSWEERYLGIHTSKEEMDQAIKEKEESWNRIFDSKVFTPNNWVGTRQNETIQGCFWRLNLDDVIQSYSFIGKSSI